MVDEYKIRLTTEADPAGAEATAEALDQVKQSAEAVNDTPIAPEVDEAQVEDLSDKLAQALEDARSLGGEQTELHMSAEQVQEAAAAIQSMQADLDEIEQRTVTVKIDGLELRNVAESAQEAEASMVSVNDAATVASTGMDALNTYMNVTARAGENASTALEVTRGAAQEMGDAALKGAKAGRSALGVIKGVEGAAKGGSSSIRALSGALKGLIFLMGSPVLLGAGLVIGAATLAWKKYTQTAEEAKKKTEELEAEIAALAEARKLDLVERTAGMVADRLKSAADNAKSLRQAMDELQDAETQQQLLFVDSQEQLGTLTPEQARAKRAEIRSQGDRRKLEREQADLAQQQAEADAARQKARTNVEMEAYRRQKAEDELGRSGGQVQRASDQENARMAANQTLKNPASTEEARRRAQANLEKANADLTNGQMSFNQITDRGLVDPAFQQKIEAYKKAFAEATAARDVEAQAQRELAEAEKQFAAKQQALNVQQQVIEKRIQTAKLTEAIEKEGADLEAKKKEETRKAAELEKKANSVREELIRWLETAIKDAQSRGYDTTALDQDMIDLQLSKPGEMPTDSQYALAEAQKRLLDYQAEQERLKAEKKKKDGPNLRIPDVTGRAYGDGTEGLDSTEKVRADQANEAGARQRLQAALDRMKDGVTTNEIQEATAAVEEFEKAFRAMREEDRAALRQLTDTMNRLTSVTKNSDR